MSDYHDYSVYASCGSSLVPPSTGKGYFLTHPALRNADSDFVNLKYAYVKIAYRCEEFVEGSDKATGWGLLENFSPNAPKVKPSPNGPEPNHYMFHDIACQSFRTMVPGGGSSGFSGKLFSNGQNVAGCNLVFTTEPTHELNGRSSSMWESSDGPSCPNALADKGNISKIAVYSSPVICISGQLMRYPTLATLYQQYLNAGGGRQDSKSLGELKLIANNNAWKLRRAIYDILCPCHQCKDIGKGTFIAVNNCIPCVCRKGTTETCYDTSTWFTTYTENGRVIVDNLATTTCPPGDPYSNKISSPNCIKCKPKAVVKTLVSGNKTWRSTSTFCKDGTFCKTAKTTRYRAQCGYASRLLPLNQGTCVKVKHVKALVGEVNSLIQEAQQFSSAYLLRSPLGMLTYVAKDDKDWTRAMRMQAKGLTNLMVPSIPYKTIVKKKLIELKTISTTCPPLVWVTTSTAVKKIIQWKPLIVRPRTVTYSYQTRKDICKINPKTPDKNLELLCLCNENECLDQDAMFSVIAKLAVHIEKLTKSMCIPWRLAPKKDKPVTTTATDNWTFDPGRETVIPGDGMTTVYPRTSVACSSHRCLTSFPMKCNCIQKPKAPDATYEDNEIFRCKHTVATRTLTALTTYVKKQYRIYGHVYLPDGTTGLDGVTITLSPTGDTATTGNGTWEQGYYEFTGLNNGEFTLTPSPSSGYTFKVMPGDTDPPANVTISNDSELQDFKATEIVWNISGQVYKKGTSPKEGIARVRVSTGGHQSPDTGSDGIYTISNVPNGTYTLSVSGNDDYTYETDWTGPPDPPSVTVNGSSLTGKDWKGTEVPPVTYELKGTCYDTNGTTTLAGVVVHCGTLSSPPTGGDGKYTISDIPESSSVTPYASMASRTLSPYNWDGAPFDFPPSHYGIDFKADALVTRSISGTCYKRGDHDVKLPDIVVTAVSDTKPENVYSSAGSSSDGKYAVNNVPDNDTYTLSAVDPTGDYVALSGIWTGTPGDPEDPPAPKVVLSGENATGKDYEGDPVVGTKYTLKGKCCKTGTSVGVGGVLVTCGGQSGTSLDSGEYTVPDIPAGSYTPTAVKGGWGVFSPKWEPNPSPPYYELPFPPDQTGRDFEATQILGSISGVVSKRNSNTPVYVKDAVIVATEEGGSNKYTSPSSDENGNYTISGVPFGTYVLSGSGGGYQNYSGTWTGTPGNPQDPGAPNVVMHGDNELNKNFVADKIPDPTYSIEGHCYEDTAKSEPAENVVVSCDGKTYTTKVNGYYILSGISAGDHSVTATKSGWTFSPDDWSSPVHFPPSTSGKDFIGIQYWVSGTIWDRSVEPSVPLTDAVHLILRLNGSEVASLDTSTGIFTFTAVATGTPYTITTTNSSGWTIVAKTGTQPFTVGTSPVTGRDFDATKIVQKYKIKGNIYGVSGYDVTISDGTRSTTVGPSPCSYEIVDVPGGGITYTVTPNFAGGPTVDTFSPTERSVTVNATDVNGVDFTIQRPEEVVISGRVVESGTTTGVYGVKITATRDPMPDPPVDPLSAITDSEGRYIISDVASGTYTLEATNNLEANDYDFTDDYTKPVTVPPSRTDCDFNATTRTYSIGGFVYKGDTESDRLEGVAISGLGDMPLTGSDGVYNKGGLLKGPHTVGASKIDYDINPIGWSSPVNVPPSHPSNKFKAIQVAFTLSGKVTDTSTGLGLDGVSVTGYGSGATTAGGGFYSIAHVPSGTTVTLAASISGYTVVASFTQPFQVFSDKDDRHFSATPIPPPRYHIRGKAVLKGTSTGVAGVTIAQTDSTFVATTIADGTYVSVPTYVDGTYTVKGGKASCTVKPDSQDAIISGADALNVDFTVEEAAPATYTVSGVIRYSGSGIGGITVALSHAGDPDRTTTTASGTGAYSFASVSPGSYSLTPSSSLYNFVTDPGGNIPPTFIGVTDSNVIQNYIATDKKYSINGRVTHDGAGLSGILVDIARKSTGQIVAAVTTNPSGYYSSGLLLQAAYKVYPVDPLYTFSPIDRDVTITDHNVYNIDFAATDVMSTVSGIVTCNGVGLGSVSVILSPSSLSATTISNGTYSISNVPAGSYTASASIAGYSVLPVSQPVSVPPSKTGINFTATQLFYMEGTVYETDHHGTTTVVSGLQIVCSNRDTKFTDANGVYRFTGLQSGGTYTVEAPVRANFTCSPATRTYTRVATQNWTGLNFTYVEDTHTISGHVYLNGTTTPLADANVSIPGHGVAVSNASGYYSKSLIPNGSYTLSAGKTGYSITPRNFSNPVVVNNGSRTNIDWNATATTPTTYIIWGAVTKNGSGLGGVVIYYNEAHTLSVISEPDTGIYATPALADGTAYDLTALYPDHSFTTSGAPASGIMNSDKNVNFAATALEYTISGTVSLQSNGDPLPGVTVTGVPSVVGGTTSTDTTDALGEYTIGPFPSGCTVTVTPTKPESGYSFQNPSESVPIGGGNVSDIDFTAIMQLYSISGTITNQTSFSRVCSVTAVGPETGSSSSVTVNSGATVPYIIADLPYGWYVVTPSIAGSNYTVAPPNYAFTLDSNQTNKNFTIVELSPEPLSVHTDAVPKFSAKSQHKITVSSTNSYPAHVYDSDACSIAYPCSDGVYADASAMDKVYMHPVWLYRGWQMMGQVSLSDYIKRFFGYSWSMVPGCCHGTDCLGQWHFEMLWRVTQALLRGSFDQFQGVAGKTDVIYKLAHCGPPDCGVGPFFKEYRALFYNEPDAEGYEQTVTQLMAPPSVSENSTVPSPKPKAMSMVKSKSQTWKDFDVVGHIAIEDSKYWLASGTFSGKNHSYMRTYVAINIRDGRELFGEPEQLDGLTVLVDKQSWDTPEVELHMALLKALKCRYHMHENEEWGKDSLAILLRLIGASSSVPGFKFWFNTLIVSLVVDGIISAEQFGDLSTQLPDGLVNPRSNSLAIDYEALRIKMEQAVQESDDPVSIPDIPEVPDLAKELSNYVDSAVRNASVTLDPDSLYQYAGMLVHAFDSRDEFVLLYEESMDSAKVGCTSCRLERIKKEMYAAFCYAVTKYPDRKRLDIVNAWSMNLPEAFLIRTMDNFRFKDIRRWELIPKKYMDAKKIVVNVHMAVGDMISVTNAVAELKRLHPEYRVWVDGACMEMWDNNPNIERSPVPEDAVWISLGAGMQGIPECHFIDVYPYSLFQQLGLKPDFQLHKGDLHLSELEKSPDYVYNKFGVQPGKYWLIVAGYKMDLPLKHWGPPDSVANYQELVRMTRDKVQWVQVGKTDAGDHHKHFRLEGALDLLGHTNNSLRDLFALVYHAQGVVCPNTCAVHIAMAFAVPCVSIGGGKESKAWCEYAKWGRPHKYITTIGKLGCCDGTSCSMGPDKCKSVASDGGSKCMSMITPAMVAEEVLSLAGTN